MHKTSGNAFGKLSRIVLMSKNQYSSALSQKEIATKSRLRRG
jgi:hypothetical protein